MMRGSFFGALLLGALGFVLWGGDALQGDGEAAVAIYSFIFFGLVLGALVSAVLALVRRLRRGAAKR